VSNDILFGPIEYLAVEFPGGVPPKGSFDGLLGMVDSGTVRILDLEFVAKSEHGEVRVVPTRDIEGLADFEGSASGLIDSDDIASVSADLAAGSVAAVLVYEERVMIPVIEAWTEGGGRLITEGHLTVDDIAAALDETDTHESANARTNDQEPA
jgi:hypothetical protein